MRRIHSVMVYVHVLCTRHKKITHLAMFAVIAITLTIIGEKGLAKFSLGAFFLRLIHLGGELVADRVVGKGFFNE